MVTYGALDPAYVLMQQQCIARLKATELEIARVRRSGLVYADAERTLDSLQESIEVQVGEVTDACTQTTLEEACASSLKVLSWLLPVLGMVVRSSNLRIAFELYPPLKRLTNRLLGGNIPVLLSSDWDYYPTTQLGLHRELVVIGLPATESSNALVIPLAGHELGHHLWAKRQYAKALSGNVTRRLLQCIRETYWSQFLSKRPVTIPANISKSDLEHQPEVRKLVRQLASRAVEQLEEYFCDALALHLFSESYLHALRYLTLPGRTERTDNYPPLSSRVRWLQICGTSHGISVPEHFLESFSAPRAVTPSSALLDDVVEHFVSEVQRLAHSNAIQSQLPTRDESLVRRIADRFAALAPPDGQHALTDIVNAAWVAYNDYSPRKELCVSSERWREIVNQMTLKTCEISQFHEKTAP